MPGGSWKTALVGYIVIAGDVLKLVADTVEKQGIPTEPAGWITFGVAFATGVGLIVSKDYDKTNSSHPVPQAVMVPDAPAGKP